MSAFCERCGGSGLVAWAPDVQPGEPEQLVFDLGVALQQPCPVCSADADDDDEEP